MFVAALRPSAPKSSGCHGDMFTNFEANNPSYPPRFPNPTTAGATRQRSLPLQYSRRYTPLLPRPAPSHLAQSVIIPKLIGNLFLRRLGFYHHPPSLWPPGRASYKHSADSRKAVALRLVDIMPPIERDSDRSLRHQLSASSDHGRALIPMFVLRTPWERTACGERTL